MNIEDSILLETESSLIRKHKSLLMENRYDTITLDLGEPIPIFKWFISEKSTWEKQNVMYNTESLLNKIAASHKQYPNDIIRKMLFVAAQRMRNISKGGMISSFGYKLIINKAIELKDITEVEPNAEIRYLKNPYYVWSKDDFPKRKKIYRDELNKFISNDKTEKNYELIKVALIDYDLLQKKMNKAILKNITNLSLSTIKNYLKKHSELIYIYESIREHSGTENQRKNKEYNFNKKKVA